METVALTAQSLCVPCHCRCRHCLLGYSGTVRGADYERAKALARRLKAECPVDFGFNIGYCMDTPELLDYVRFCRELGSPGGRLLQMNGFAPRPPELFTELLGTVKDAGVELIDLTFYGARAYHDRFAGRPGDFDILLTILGAANRVGLPVHISGPITEENKDQWGPLLEDLGRYEPDSVLLYLPHAKGRGLSLDKARLNAGSLEALPDSVRDCMPRVKTRTEAAWLAENDYPQTTRRYLTLGLTAENIGKYEIMSTSDILAELEGLDDAFYAQIPPARELAALYGDPASQKLYRVRDLVLLWTRRYLADHPVDTHDMTDERGHFSVRQ